MSAYLRLGLALFLVCFLAGCSFLGDIPPQFRIDQGIDPEYQDKDLRFRTNYYFRVFDLCEGDEGERDSVSPEPSGQIFRKNHVGPLRLRNDSLYRFRMTGKASAFFNSVHFESGTLRAEQIDSFGSNVRYDEKVGSFKVISAQQNKDESALDAKVKEIDKLLKVRSTLKDVSGGQAELDSLVLEKIRGLGDYQQAQSYSLQLAALDSMEQAQQAKKKADMAASEVLDDYTAEPLTSVPAEATEEAKLLNSSTTREQMKKQFALAKTVSAEAVEKISTVVVSLQKKAKELEKEATNRKELDKVKVRLDRALTYANEARDELRQIEKFSQLATSKIMETPEASPAVSGQLCSNGQQARRGFQILGPEGFRTFDQDERLLMAFSYNAKPVISLLQELSSRKLSVRTGAESLRELATERIRFRDAIHEVDKIKLELEKGNLLDAPLSPEGIIKRIEERFNTSAEHTTPSGNLPSDAPLSPEGITKGIGQRFNASAEHSRPPSVFIPQALRKP